jgi:nucleotide-binding universal stress UspA family protein
MLPFRNIVMPVDYSEHCQKVVPYVKEFMHRFSARLTLVHAYGAEALAYSDLALVDPGLSDEAHAAEQERLREFTCRMFPTDHVERVVALGEVGGIIENVVRRQGADLVMLGTHGWGPVRRLLLGSVASKVLHDLSTPVWTCTGPALTNANQPGSTSQLCARSMNLMRQKVC